MSRVLQLATLAFVIRMSARLAASNSSICYQNESIRDLQLQATLAFVIRMSVGLAASNSSICYQNEFKGLAASNSSICYQNECGTCC
ncbi:hypothetical protein CEXT_463161 [Caerostris extrusa]|uniref:Secreted protein n=1 Tax=Caerostris extrusa TaxID=172846 RepID=A0AAV4P192_CAEEX|nr:hypothetical protein CEXT_463161 [Caerostris extrusa]